MENFKQLVEAINKDFSTLHNISDDELRSRMADLEKAINSSSNKSQALDTYLVPVYSIVKETARRFSEGDIIVTANAYDKKISELYDFVQIKGDKAIYKNHWDVTGVPFVWNMVHYDEQLLGGILLHYGYATEMATGEGKTLVATLPVFLNALTHEGVHLMTVNDYLSKRDFETTRPIYMFYGLTADCIEKYPRHDKRFKEAYKSDIVFGTNSRFTFDYLNDHLAITPQDCVQTKHNYAIIDELDAILIDDADNPHVVGGGNYYNHGKFFKENYPIVKELIAQEGINLYKIDILKKSAEFTKEGKEWLAAKKNIPDLYDIERTYQLADFDSRTTEEQHVVRQNLFLQNVLSQLLLALTVYERDIDYIVEDNKVKIIDPHTGRVKKTSRWEHGLHTAIEIKENVKIEDDFDGMAVISLKNYFKLYAKIAGMSGTIMPVEDELKEIYNLNCALLPTHKPLRRIDKPFRIFKDTAEKDAAIIQTIIDNKNSGRPTLIGSITIKRADELCLKLDELGIEYNKLHARNLDEEAIMVSKAGLHNTVTVSTSVAGRGTDIKPSEDAINAGGLMVIGTDLFESVRVDRQLKGRTGRQGDPGSSVIFASLQDQILKNLQPEDVLALEKKSATLPEGEIFDETIRNFFVKAQSNREAYFKNCRKETARKDDIIAPLRKKFYEQRNAVLFNADVAISIVKDIILHANASEESINKHLELLYLNTKELINRSRRNNLATTHVHLPFSDNLHPFAIHLEVIPTIASYEYFCKEFKRQIILQIYDKEWKKFVLYMMGNLDKTEIEMLDDKYLKMLDDINSIILRRLQYSSILFEIRTKVVEKEQPQTDKVKETPPNTIKSDDYCPCGSGKKYCECHQNIRSNTRKKRRR